MRSSFQAAHHLADLHLSQGKQEEYLHWLEIAAKVDGRANFRYALELNKLGKFEAAFSIFKEQADGGSAVACFNTGMAYLTGQGCAPDSVKAVHYIQIASEKNFWPAKNNLALLLIEGRIVQKDLPAAEFLLEDILANAPDEYKPMAQERLQELRN